MPESGVAKDNQFYSFDLGPIHFVALSSEYYGFGMQKEAKAQFEWLKSDLQVWFLLCKTAQKVRQPWTISYFHRPYYCSDLESNGCSGKVATLVSFYLFQCLDTRRLIGL